MRQRGEEEKYCGRERKRKRQQNAENVQHELRQTKNIERERHLEHTFVDKRRNTESKNASPHLRALKIEKRVDMWNNACRGLFGDDYNARDLKGLGYLQWYFQL